MTGEEKRELQDLLAEGIKQRGQTPDDILRDTDVPLDEDSGQFFVTQHERIVFQLECKGIVMSGWRPFDKVRL